MVKKTGLGRGIASLLPVVEERGRIYFSCPIEEIRPLRGQPRKTFSGEKLEELAASIRENGIIQPLVVRNKNDYYELIAGERRWRAAQKAGLREVPVVIQDVSDQTALEMALVENIQREDLNAVEEAEAYQALMDSLGLSQEELARRVGKERSTVANSLRLLKLPEEIKKDIVEERLTMGHGRSLLPLADSPLMRQARDEIVRRGMSVRDTESLVRRLQSGPMQRTRNGVLTPELTDLQERLKRHFKAKVAITRSGKKGKIEISFGDTTELTRIIELLGI
jgi:ParB family transcriptional regulator, chromosome partitioning protein